MNEEIREEIKEETTEEKEIANDYTHIAIVLDRSGSMGTTQNETIDGFNEFLGQQQAVEGRATMTVAQFDDHYDVLQENVPLSSINPLSLETFVPRGMTALLDAIGRTMNDTEYYIDQLDEKPSRVIFVIITDGGENSSKEFSREQVFEMINRHREENHWEVVFIGANQDAIGTGGSMGVRAASSMTYAATDIGTNVMYSSLSRSMTNYRTKGFEEVAKESFEFFSEDDRKAQEEAIKGMKGSTSEKDFGGILGIDSRTIGRTDASYSTDNNPLIVDP